MDEMHPLLAELVRRHLTPEEPVQLMDHGQTAESIAVNDAARQSMLNHLHQTESQYQASVMQHEQLRQKQWIEEQKARFYADVLPSCFI